MFPVATPYALPQSQPSLVRPARPSQPLELAPVPGGFLPVDDLDGSINYREPRSQLKQKLTQAGLEILGVRHGQSQSNADSDSLGSPLLYGQSESPLTEKGREQARQCALQLLEQMGGKNWLEKALRQPKLLPILISSDLSRAVETSSLLKLGLAEQAEKLLGAPGRLLIEQNLIQCSDYRLRETHFGSFEKRSLAELQAAHPDFVNGWRPNEGLSRDFRHRFPQGESRADVMTRVASLLENSCQVYPQRTLVLISHGETLLSTRALLGQAPVTAGKVVAEVGKLPNAQPIWLLRHGFALPELSRCDMWI